MLAAGQEIEKHLGRAAELAPKACDGGMAASCGLARRHVRGGLADGARRRQGRLPLRPRLHGRRRHELRPPRRRWSATAAASPATRLGPSPLARKSCDAGLAAACVALATALQKGEGVPADPAAGARRSSRRAATAASRGAASASASSCATAPERARDLKRAAELFRQACDGKVGAGCYELGQLVGRGRGVPLDLAQATSLFRQACTDGDPRGCVTLGQLFQSGRGVVRDLNRAAALFDEACEKGDLAGCSALAAMLLFGETIPRDVPARPRPLPEDLRRRHRRGLLRSREDALDDAGGPQGRVRAQQQGLRRQRGRRLLRGGRRLGGGREPLKALPFYQKACAGRHAPSCERAKKLQQ